eukprot:Nitzschia sp. Nitz4//scaffold33_size148984//16272//18304//NITZ4_002911-RA/size148984-snap-gene-0.16-mRNA-1//-1//CDS//3329548376//4842//frame0
MLIHRVSTCRLVLWLLITFIVSVASSSPLSKVISHGPKIEHVKQTLCSRMDHVLKGKRMSDFQYQDANHRKVMFSSFRDEETMSQSDRKKSPNHLPLLGKVNWSMDGPTKILQNDLEVIKPTTLRLVFRAVRLFLLFLPVLLTFPVAALSKQFRRSVWYPMLVRSLGWSGAAFIKWGQWAATRPDMFPESLCNALQTLQSGAPSHSWRYSQSQIEKGLSIPPGSLLQVFQSIDRHPIASGSIAQIHKAHLANGKMVAIKVRHPSVVESIALDFKLMEGAATMLDSCPLWRGPNVRSSVAQFHHTMASQASLHVEAHHLEILNHNFRHWKNVKFPRPVFATSSIILETFEPGLIVSDYLDAWDTAAKRSNLPDVSHGYELIPWKEAKFLVTTGVSVYLKMILMDNVLHADLHPGNILLHGFDGQQHDKHDKVPDNLHITLVDAGMVAQLSDEESTSFIGLLTSLGEGDGVAAANFLLRFSSANELTLEAKEAFQNDMVSLFQLQCRGYGANVDVSSVLRGMLRLIRKHRIQIDANYATLVINVLSLESLSRRVCPSYNVLDAARPLLRSYRYMVFDRDGYTPRRSPKLTRTMVPLLLSGRKRAMDDAFFRKQPEGSAAEFC